MNVLLWILTFILAVTSVLMVLVILAQRAKSDGGVGAALGGGMAEAAFGGGSSTVLAKLTRYAAILFFVLSFVLYLGQLHLKNQAADAGSPGLPSSPGLLPESGADGAAEGVVIPDGLDAAADVADPQAAETSGEVESAGDVDATGETAGESVPAEPGPDAETP